MQFCAPAGAGGAAAACEVFREIPLMNFIQAGLATAVAYACILFQGKRFQRVGHALDLLPPAVTHTIASPVGYMAMGYIPFPLYILVSSCKLIPVLLVGVLLNPSNARPLQDYVSAVIMTEGVVLYSNAQKHGEEAPGTFYDTFLGFSLKGLPLVQLCVGVGLTLSNLFLEGFTNGAQDRVNLAHKAAGRRTMPSLQMMAECVQALRARCNLPPLIFFIPSPSPPPRPQPPRAA